MAKKKRTRKKKAKKTIATITHDEASRKNIPTAEYHSVLRDDEQTPIQVAGSSMVDCVVMSPVIIGRKGQHTCDEAQDIIGLPRIEKRTMTTVVKDNEGAHHKTSCGYRQ